MAKSKYEYVKSFEVNDALPLSSWIVVRIDGYHFHRFSNVHNFKKPDDERALNLMNSCAVSMLKEFPDIVFAYGTSDKYSFIMKKSTHFYNRRVSKITSIIASIFSSTYVYKWNEFFPHEELQYQPSFVAEVDFFVSVLEVRDYLSSRQDDCGETNLLSTCFWMLVKSGKSETKAEELLRGTNAHEKTELLYQQFGIDYNMLPAIFRKGSIAFKIRVEAIVKHRRNGEPVKRLQRKVVVQHTDIIGPNFWKEHPDILHDSTKKCRVAKIGMANSSEVNDTPSTFHVIRVDGRHFHKFSDDHGFEKPNDERALNLMNACAMSMLQEIPDIVLAYGVSDEYSFIMKKAKQFCNRRIRKIISLVASFFSSTYVINWKEFFPQKRLLYPPSFDARVICYPSTSILRDYLSWRQADCHVNNQYNTPFWMLRKSGKSKSEAQEHLKGTQAAEKNDILFQQFSIDYDTLPAMFRKGSIVFKSKVEDAMEYCNNDKPFKSLCVKFIVEHTDIIEPSFWEAHPGILDE